MKSINAKFNPPHSLRNSSFIAVQLSYTEMALLCKVSPAKLSTSRDEKRKTRFL